MQPTSKKPARKDWHPADVKAALEKNHTSLRQLSLAQGYNQHYCSNAFKQGGHNVQSIIATALGMNPWDIWPSRYDDNNEPITRRKPFSYTRPETWTKPGCKTSTKDTAPAENLNGQAVTG